MIYTQQSLQKTKVYDTYWQFACERQNIFMRKAAGLTENLTEDPILKVHKFTNAYRASDRVSQYLIKDVIYKEGYSVNDISPEDILFRILLFKTFNNIETWKRLEEKLGQITYKNFNVETYGKALSELYAQGVTLYSGAYIMASGKSAFGHERKFMNHLSLIDFMMKDQVTDKILRSKQLEEIYQILLEYPTIGTFLGYQYTIDINYSELVDFSENEFVIAGPGAKAGIRKCFSNSDAFSEAYIIQYMCEHQEEEFARLRLDFATLGGRKLQLIDCQNVFCETDKYSRVKFPDVADKNGRTRIKQKYKMKPEPIEYFYPPKWGINDKINFLVSL